MKDRNSPQAGAQEKLSTLRARVADLQKQCRRQRQAEQRLQLLDSALNQAIDGLVVADADGNLLFTNTACASMHGYTPKELKDKALSLFHKADQQPAFEAVLRQLKQTGEFRGECWHTRRDGSTFPTLTHMSALRDDAGEVVGLITNIRDITEHKRAEQALRESERTLATLMSNLPGMVYRCLNDPDWTMKFVSDGCLDLTGYQPADLLDNRKVSYAQLIHPQDRDMVWRHIQKALGRREPFRLTYRISTADGREKWVWEQGRGVFSPDEKLLSLEGFITDITQRRRAEDALRESWERFRAIADYTYNLETWVGPNGRLLWVNPAGHRLTGYTVPECMAMPDFPLPLVHEDDRKRMAGIFRAADQSGSGNDVRFRLRRKDGTVTWMAVSWQPLLDAKGGPLGYRASIRDVSERKHTEDKLRQSENLLRTVINATKEAMISIDERGRITLFNPAAEEMFARKADDMIGQPLDCLMPESYQQPHREYVRSYFATGKPDNVIGKLFELPALRADGTEFPMEISLAAGAYDDRKFVIAVARDITVRKQADRELRESEKRFQDIADNALEWIWEVNAEGKYTYSNPVVERILGYAPEEVCEKHFYDFFHPEDREERKEVAFRIFAQKQPFRQFSNRNQHKDGRTVWLSTSGVPILDEQGNLLGYRGADIDITEQRRAEKELRESKQMLQLVLDNIPQRIFWKDRSSVYLGCNKMFAHDAGLDDPDDIIRKTDYDLPWRKEEADFYRQVDSRVIGSGRPELHFTEPQLQADGTQAWLETNKVPLRDADGNIVGMLGTYEDITERIHAEQERERAEQQLRESEERFNLALEATRAGLWDWDVPSGRAVFSPRYYEMLGYEHNEIPPSYETWADLLHSDDRERAERIVADCVERKKDAFEIEFRMRHKSGQWRWILSHGKAVEHDSKGRVKRMVGTHVDITERRLLEEQLRQTQKMESLGTLTSGIAHDFNNLLTIIMGNSSFMAGKVEQGSNLHNALTDIEKASARAGSLIQQLLAFSRRSVLQMRPTDLQQCVDETVALLDRTIDPSIKIDVRKHSTLWIIHADPGQMNQVIMNLCVNARDSMPSGGKITIEAKNVVISKAYCRRNQNARPGEYVRLTVTDTGAGMDRKTRDRVFEPFFTTKKAGVGTGLGLSMAYGIVTQHGGWITVDSKPRRGSSFNIFLPRSGAHEELRAPETETDLPAGSETILLVDDEQLILDVADRILLGCGYNTVTAVDGRQAIDLFRDYQDEIDLVILDITLPDMDGFQVLAAIRKVKPDVRVILCSGDVMQETSPQAEKLAAEVPRLSKPLRAETLARAVRRTLDT